MQARLKEIIGEVIAETGAWLIEMETIPDHMHLLVEVDPQFGIHILVKAIKGPLIAAAAPGVWVAEVALADVVDELVFRGNGGWGAVVGDQTLCGRPEEPVSDAGW